MISKKEEISPILVSRSLNNRSNTIYLYICLDSLSDPCEDCAFCRGVQTHSRVA